MNLEKDKAYIYFTAFFCSALVIASVLSSKILEIASFTAPAGIIAYSLSYLCTDIIGEVYGPEASKTTIKVGFFSLIMATLLVQLSLILPGASFWQNEDAFISIFKNNSRIVLASLTAYVASQSSDHLIFHFLRKKTNRKHLWIRNNVSTIVAQIIDSLIFILIGFGISPVFFQLVLGQCILKMVIAFMDTPLVYLGVHLITKQRKPLATNV